MKYNIIPYEKNKWTVYVHKNKINNKKYVGITSVSPKRRWRNGTGYKCCRYFYSAIQKYGWDNFDHIIVKTGLTHFEANIYEMLLIKSLKTQSPEYGYNILSGGYLGTKDFKMSKSSIYKRSGSNHPCAKSVICLNDGIIFNTIKEAGKAKEINYSSISECCNGNQKYAGKSSTGEYYQWMWLEDYLSCDKTSLNTEKINDLKITNSHPVICLNTNQIFNSLQKAMDFAGLKQTSGIVRCCKGIRNFAGRHPETKELLRWMYLDDYEKISIESKDNLKQLPFCHKEIHTCGVICLNSLEEFSTLSEAIKYTTLHTSYHIKDSCENENKSSGKHIVTGEKLYWKYSSDYKNLTDKQKLDLKNRFYTGSFLLPKKEVSD